MPQIGWLEILAVVIVAILVLGPKEFPVAVKKIGSYVAKFKNFFSNIQKEFYSATSELEIDIEKKHDKKKIIKDE
jgi:sec-independent protein translocase protein TatB